MPSQARRGAIGAAATLLVLLAATPAGTAAAAEDGAPSARVQGLVSQMTLDEKLSFVSGRLDPKPVGQAGYVPGVPRLGIPELRFADGPAGIRVNAHATALPAPIALASTFDADLARKYGQVLGQDGRALGQDVMLAPMTNIIRAPLAGRNFETFSEDPLVSSVMVGAEIQGIQGEGLIATVKHFAENNQETDRRTVNVTVDERTMREIELPAFKAAVDAGVGAVMCAYNGVNGQHACGSDELLNQILKTQWGFRGWVMSDWGATHATTDILAGLDQNMFAAGAEASPFFEEPLREAVTDGSVPMTALDAAVARIVGQMERFKLLDGAATHRPQRDRKRSARIAQEIAEAGAVLLKNDDRTLPLHRTEQTLAVIGAAATSPKIGGGGSSSVSPDAAAAPLDAIRARAGRRTRVTYASASGTASRIPLSSSPLAADGRVTVAPGKTLFFEGTITVPTTGDYVFSSEAPGAYAAVTIDGDSIISNAYSSQDASAHLTKGRHKISLLGTALQGVPAKLRFRWITPQSVAAAHAQAVKVARRADTAIVFANDLGIEGVDRADLSLPFSQDALISGVAKVNRRTIVVLNTGSSITMPWLDQVKSVLDMYYPGQNGAQATTRLLFGDATPQGRLTQTFPASEKRSPIQDDPQSFPGVDGQQTYKEGIFVGYRWYEQRHVKPLFPFGYGLSYTSFAYSDLAVAPEPAGLKVSFTVRNTGKRAGSEVPQVYVGAPKGAPVPMAPKVLAGFQRISLAPGAKRRIAVRVKPEQLSYWSVDQHGWTMPPGKRAVWVGASSQDVRLTGTGVPGPA